MFSPISIKISQYCMIIAVIVSGAMKFLSKLYIKGILYRMYQFKNLH
jgi:hypothetical protein